MSEGNRSACVPGIDDLNAYMDVLAKEIEKRRTAGVSAAGARDVWGV